jgi:DNA modification methylase
MNDAEPMYRSHLAGEDWRIYCGPAGRIPLADDSVHCCVTSPPYWSLRDYGVDGQIGLEATPEEYLARMREVFRDVRRVLRPDGTLWMNMGDCYSSGNSGLLRRDSSGGFPADNTQSFTQASSRANPGRAPFKGMEPKNLVGMPWRLALALQADGWNLRADVIWHKPNPMPESVTDRPTKSHEYVFMMAKSERYFFDQERVREATIPDPRDSQWGKTGITRFNDHSADLEQGMKQKKPAGFVRMSNPAGRNPRSVWTIPSEPSPIAHFALMPRELARRCLKAGTSERGCCPTCGAPWERVTEHGEPIRIGGNAGVSIGHSDGPMDRNGKGQWDAGHMPKVRPVSTLGWRPTCPHDAEPVPCLVLDPFAGAGTTLVVAVELKCRAVGIEINPEYCRAAEQRLNRPHAPIPRAGNGETLPLFHSIDTP